MHVVQLYKDSLALEREAVWKAARVVQPDDACVVIARPPRLHLVSRAISRCGVDPVRIDANDSVARFVRDGVLDEDSYRDAAGFLDELHGHARHVWVYAEGCALLAEKGQFELAQQLERLHVRLIEDRSWLTICCGYPEWLFAESSGLLCETFACHHEYSFAGYRSN